MTVGELLIRLGVDTTEYERGLARMEKQTQAAGTRLGDILRGALSVTLGVGLFEAIRRGFQGVVGEAVNFNAMMEQAQIGFTTMLGSAERAQAFLNEMADFAAKTPFEYPDLLMASKRMLAFGFAANEILPMLRAVGDAAAGLGLGREGIDRLILALGQMRAKAKVSGEEMRQLTEAGVPAWEILAEAMGKSTAEVMKLSQKGLIPAGQAIQWLIEGMEKRFPNMMENMQNTWEGVTSTIRDVWRMTLGALTSGLFKNLTSWLQRVRDWATDFYETFRRIGLSAALTKAFGPEFAAAVNMATAILRGFWNAARTAAVTIARYWAIIKPVVLGVAVAFLTFRMVSWVLSLVQKAVIGFTFVTAVMRGEAVSASGILNVVARAVQIYRLQLHLASMAGIAHVGVLQVLRTALYSVWAALGPLGWAIIAVSAAITAGITLWSKYAASVERANLENVMNAINKQAKEVTDTNQKVTGSSEQAAKGMDKQADATEKAGKAAGKNIQSFDEVHLIMEDTAKAAEDTATGLDKMAMPALEVPAGAALPELDTSALEKVKPTWSGFWQWLLDSAKEKLLALKDAIVNAWNWIVSKTEPIWRPVADFFVRLWDGIKIAWNAFITWASGLWSKIKDAWAWFVDWVLSWAGPLWDGIKVAWNAFVDWAACIWDGIKAAWEWFTGWVVSWAGPLWNAVQVAWQTFVGWAAQMWASVKLAWETFINWIMLVWTTITTWLIGKWEWLKSAAQTAWNLIKDYIINPIQMAWNWLVQAWDIITGVLIAVWERIKGEAEAAWGLIKDYIISPIQATWDWLVETWNTISGWLSEAWDGIKAAAQTAWGFIRDNIIDPIQEAWDRLEQIWKSIAGFLERTWDGIKRTASGIWKGIANTIIGLVNRVIDGLNWMIKQMNRISFTAPDWVPVIGGRSWGFNLPTLTLIPMLAEGGLVTAPTLAMLGERGPEAIIPLGRSGFVEEVAQAVYQATYAAIRDGLRVIYAEQGATHREIILEVDGKRIARAVIPSLISEGQRTGLPVIVRGG